MRRLLLLLMLLVSLVIPSVAQAQTAPPPAAAALPASPPPVLAGPWPVSAGLLSALAGEPPLTGAMNLSIAGLGFADSIGLPATAFASACINKPQGHWAIVYYTVQNNMSSRMQPETQVSQSFVVTDAGRQWAPADNYSFTNFDGSPQSVSTPDHFSQVCPLSETAAGAKGYVRPENWVAPGFTATTAVVFDVPVTTVHLSLVSTQLGLQTPLS